MLSSYWAELPAVFPWVVRVDHSDIRHVIGMLLNRPSSFAVTVDAPAGQVNLWLSEHSKATLSNQQVIYEDRFAKSSGME